MKTFHSPRLRRGFTLVELLVVISIIVTLAGLSLLVIQGVQTKKDKTVAVSNCRALQDGVQNYILDHNGQLPVLNQRQLINKGREKGQIEVSTSIEDPACIMAILTNYMPQGGKFRGFNTQKKAYFNGNQAASETLAGLYFGAKGKVGLLDPWNHPYYVIISTDLSESPRTSFGSHMIPKQVGVYSLGKDGEGGTADSQTENTEMTEDNPTSWSMK